VDLYLHSLMRLHGGHREIKRMHGCVAQLHFRTRILLTVKTLGLMRFFAKIKTGVGVLSVELAGVTLLCSAEFRQRVVL